MLNPARLMKLLIGPGNQAGKPSRALKHNREKRSPRPEEERTRGDDYAEPAFNKSSCCASRSAGSGGSVLLGSGADASRSRTGKDLVLNVSSPRSRFFATCALKTPSYGGRSREKINPRDLFTFSYKFNTDIPMRETPGASIDEYLLNRTRIVGAVFPDQRKRRKLNDEEWSVQLLPIQFLFLSASPVIVMRFVSKSGGKEYPPNVPVKATSLLLMEVTDYKLRGLDSNAMPSHMALTVRGILYPQREGRKSLRGHVEMTVGFNLPPALALVPEGIIRGVGETVLRQLAEQMKQDFDAGLAADFKKYSREKLTERRTSP
ncbi:hypothetical protein PR202_ga26930 [Eleusine coracana subsp. coracana]|uniref:DUF1997 family protein n=1 Tax=Eleusine coracana subsp. coracana TaxID=191504 RepID=A0AAV5DDD5_ELECO|nr:hypothetical protein PR202_ga26930 [Eleusine coracana subsp. coracana]